MVLKSVLLRPLTTRSGGSQDRKLVSSSKSVQERLSKTGARFSEEDDHRAEDDGERTRTVHTSSSTSSSQPPQQKQRTKTKMERRLWLPSVWFVLRLPHI